MYHAAKFLSEQDDCLITTVIEHDKLVHNLQGLDIDALKSYIAQNGGVKGFIGGQFNADGNKGLEDECDILIHAALENAIHEGNTHNILTKLLVDAANGSVTFEEDQILKARNVIIILDLFVNAGGVVVRYFEWVKN